MSAQVLLILQIQKVLGLKERAPLTPETFLKKLFFRSSGQDVPSPMTRRDEAGAYGPRDGGDGYFRAEEDWQAHIRSPSQEASAQPSPLSAPACRSITAADRSASILNSIRQFLPSSWGRGARMMPVQDRQENSGRFFPPV
eukprot:CAMPEP_0194324384 /NCGR_PEP_ID=MMETSP0171-20130528/27719_1 /TAXON_ID=218684 /ORGANISM="Corethron pennatum, Strain L29A3" /LENGTH=140 /DNA_ID=CAMNT_0039083275 /DNA_START=245 /DNA_END=668 /DNA_ORIENTATION=-